jgi:hypothetical protein
MVFPVAPTVVIIILLLGLWLIYKGENNGRRAVVVATEPGTTTAVVVPVATPVATTNTTAYTYTISIPPSASFPWLFSILLILFFSLVIAFLAYDIDYGVFFSTGNFVART